MTKGDFWSALGNGCIWTLGSVGIQLILGLVISLLLYEKFVGRNIFRSVVLFSYLVPTVVAALVWKFMFNDLTGIVNFLIQRFRLPVPITWFAAPETAMFSVILVNVWKFFPFMVICFLARLQTIDIQLYEAARIDGASRWQEFWQITLPALKPVVYIVLLLRLLSRCLWKFPIIPHGCCII